MKTLLIHRRVIESHACQAAGKITLVRDFSFSSALSSEGNWIKERVKGYREYLDNSRSTRSLYFSP